MDQDEQKPPMTENGNVVQKPGKTGRPEFHPWRSIALIFFCFVAAAAGSAVVLMAQDELEQAVSPNKTREVVLNQGDLIADIADKVGKSTVAIDTSSLQQTSFFGPSVEKGAGTGIIISRDGYVVTNRHVIPEGTDSVSVTTSDGKTYKNVKVIGRGTANDIAFLKIEGAKDLQPAKLGDSSKMEVGQHVIAIGNALGQFHNTVTTGVLSGVGRPIVAGEQATGATERLTNLLQTDAAINPGNSGGPLVNLHGEVIGINVAVAQNAEGIGFAIPIDSVRGFIQTVKETGEFIRPFLGVRAATLTPDLVDQLDFEVESGAYVVDGGVVDGSPAEKAGLQDGDIIVEVDGQKLDQNHVLGGVIAKHKPGDEVTLKIMRDGEAKTLRATLEKFPEELNQ